MINDVVWNEEIGKALESLFHIPHQLKWKVPLKVLKDA